MPMARSMVGALKVHLGSAAISSEWHSVPLKCACIMYLWFVHLLGWNTRSVALTRLTESSWVEDFFPLALRCAMEV